MVDDRQQARSGNDFDLAGPGSLGAASLWANDATTPAGSCEGCKQDAGDTRQRSVERQLPQSRVKAELFYRERVHGRQQTQCDWQVEVAAFLGNVRRSEVDGDPFGRQRQAERAKRRAHPLAGFGNRLIRQPDHSKGRQPGRDRHLSLDLDDLDPVKGHRAYL